jgi:hypothetical protein
MVDVASGSDGEAGCCEAAVTCAVESGAGGCACHALPAGAGDDGVCRLPLFRSSSSPQFSPPPSPSLPSSFLQGCHSRHRCPQARPLEHDKLHHRRRRASWSHLPRCRYISRHLDRFISFASRT